MHRVRITQPRYDQIRPYVGQIGEVIGHWSAETNEEGRDGYLVEFPDGRVIGVAEDEAENVPNED